MQTTIIQITTSVFATAVLLLAGCATATSHGPHKAIVQLHPTAGHAVHGVVTFTKVSGGVRVVADIEELTPGVHGFHVHEKGDCSAPDASSAGGHFNPTGMSHCGPDCTQRHVGDLGNVIADNTGRAHYNRIDTQLKLDGPNSIIGRSVIVHDKADDLKSQPTGGAGQRAACGVIEAAE